MSSVTLLELHNVSPFPEPTSEFSIPLVFFDILYYEQQKEEFLLFFEFPNCCMSTFLETIIPRLTKSLSLTLCHFLPLAGNIVHPLNHDVKNPNLRYTPGDSAPFRVCVSEADFHHQAGNHPRVTNEFYGFVPPLKPATSSELSMMCPIMAVQVTLFPGHGMCIGLTYRHCSCDYLIFQSFIRSWGLIANMQAEELVCATSTKTVLVKANCFPSYNREIVGHDNSIGLLNGRYWDMIRKRNSTPTSSESSIQKLPTDKVRFTFVLTKDELEKLKKYILAERGDHIKHVSSMVVMSAMLCVCTAKAALSGGELVADDEPEYLGFMADCRGKMDPQLPDTYFGNCVLPLVVELNHGQLKGDLGFLGAVEAIGEAIKRWKMKDRKAMLQYADEWYDYKKTIDGKRQYWVGGSSRIDFYDVDHGWGRPKKFEAMFVNKNGSVLLNKSQHFDGGMEITSCNTQAFVDVFSHVLGDVVASLTSG